MNYPSYLKLSIDIDFMMNRHLSSSKKLHTFKLVICAFVIGSSVRAENILNTEPSWRLKGIAFSGVAQMDELRPSFEVGLDDALIIEYGDFVLIPAVGMLYGSIDSLPKSNGNGSVRRSEFTAFLISSSIGKQFSPPSNFLMLNIGIQSKAILVAGNDDFAIQNSVFIEVGYFARNGVNVAPLKGGGIGLRLLANTGDLLPMLGVQCRFSIYFGPNSSEENVKLNHHSYDSNGMGE